MHSGYKLEHFDVERDPIGRGGFGAVYVATVKPECPFKNSLPKKVALKKVKNTVSSANVQKECLIMQSLMPHHQIVEFYGTFKERTGENYLVMELCQHGDLRKYVSKGGHLSNETIAGIMKQLLAAMRHWHKRKIMHRDLSAGNVLIASLPTDNDSVPTVKVTDFGLAREVGTKPATTFAGTPGYMAPEMDLETGYNEAADIYSLGCLLFFMVTGREPAKHEDLSRSDDLKGLDRSVVKLILGMTKAQKERYTMGDIVHSDFMIQCGGMEPSKNSISRDRSSSQVRRERHSREISSMHEHLQQKKSGGYAEQGQLERRSRPETRPPREHYRNSQPQQQRSGSRAGDSGFQSDGYHRGSSQPPNDNRAPRRAQSAGPSRPGAEEAQQLPRVDPYSHLSVKEFHARWPVPVEHIRNKKEYVKGKMRCFVYENGHVYLEQTDAQGYVSHVVRISFRDHVFTNQMVDIYEMTKNARLPTAEAREIAMDSSNSYRRGPYTRMTDLPKEEKAIYTKTCFVLFQLGHDVVRIQMSSEEVDWGVCQLMENGDMRILPKDKGSYHDKLFRKRATKGKVDYKRAPSGGGSSSPINDRTTQQLLERIYETMIDFEALFLRRNMKFPYVISPMRSKTVTTTTAATRTDSVASAPAHLSTQRMPLREVQYTMTSSRGAPSSTRPMPTTAPSSTRTQSYEQQEYKFEELRGNRGRYSVTHIPSGRYMRMATTTDGWFIYQETEHSREKRFDGVTEPVPPEAEDLYYKLKATLSVRHRR